MADEPGKPTRRRRPSATPAAHEPVAPDGRVAAVVLGMHRSGTSAVTRLLSLLGADLPQNLWPANEANETGYWEAQPITDLNDEILASAMSSWDDAAAFPASWYGSTSEAAFRARATELLAAEYGASPLFVLKDPRLCRIVPFWQNALSDFEAQPCFVLVIRNPLEVAASLKTRDGFSTAKGLLLWLRHTLDAEHATRGHPRVVVSYERLLRDWEGQARTISDQLQLPWPKLGNRTRVEIDRFLGPDRRHEQFSIEELVSNEGVVDWVRATFVALEAAAEGEIAPDSSELDEIRASLDLADAAYGPVLAESELNRLQAIQLSNDEMVKRGEAERHAEEISTTLSQRETEAAAMRAGLDEYKANRSELEKLIEGLRSEVESRDSQITAQRAGLAEHEATITALRSGLAERDAQLAELRSNLAEREAAMDELTAKLDEAQGATEAQLAERDAQISDLDQGVTLLSAQVVKGEADLEKARARLAKRKSEVAGLRKAVAKHEKARAALASRVDETEKSRQVESAEREAEIARLESELADVEKVEDKLLAVTERVAELEATICESDEAKRRYRAMLEDRDRRLADLESSLGDRDESLAQALEGSSAALGEAEALKSEVDQLRGSISSRDSELRAEADERQRLGRDLEQRAGEMRAQTIFIREQDAKIRMLEDQVAEARRELRALVATRSWRLTAPLRRLSRMRMRD